jgi:hypothetical protein
MAGRIAVVNDAYEMLTKGYEWNNVEEIDFFLLFRDPLTLVADALELRRNKMSNDFYNAMGSVMHSDYILAEYPLVEGCEGKFQNNITIKKQ